MYVKSLALQMRHNVQLLLFLILGVLQALKNGACDLGRVFLSTRGSQVCRPRCGPLLAQRNDSIAHARPQPGVLGDRLGKSPRRRNSRGRRNRRPGKGRGEVGVRLRTARSRSEEPQSRERQGGVSVIPGKPFPRTPRH